MGFTEIITFFGGIALFLFGLSAMGDGLKSLAGNKMETILWKLSSNPVKGFLLGILVTAVIQSSSATTIMVVSFINAGMMVFPQGLCIILGANIGTTMTGWILSISGAESGVGDILSTTTLFSVLFLCGVILRLVAKKASQKHLGYVLIGLGTILLAMKTISGAVAPLTGTAGFQSVLTFFENNPVMGVLAGIFVAGVTQSCSAAVGILQAVSLTCAISLHACVPMILGMNIGAAVPVLFSMVGATKDGRRAALGYVMSNVVGLAFISLLYYPLNAIFGFGIMREAANTYAIGIPLINTGIRIVTAALLLPCHKLLEKLIYLIAPVKPSENEDTEEIDNLSETLLNYAPAALERSRTAVEKMAQLSRDNLTRAIGLISTFDKQIFNVVQDKEALVDKYEDKLGNYIVKIGKNPLDKVQQASVSGLLSAIGDFERLSDHAANLSEVGQEIFEKKIVFSKEAQGEIAMITAAIEEIIGLTYTAFIDHNVAEARRVEPLEEIIDELCKEMRAHHIERLQRNNCTILTGFVFNDLLTNLERVSDHCANIAFSVMHSTDVDAEEHDYSENIMLSPEFQEDLANYRDKYSLHTRSMKEAES